MPEFETAQDVADAAHGQGVSNLVLDGYEVKDMPEELRAAYTDLVDAVLAQEEAAKRFKALLPEAAAARFWRERDAWAAQTA